jgi:uncharacterized membrane protein YbaN (DUF454 family)
MIKHFMSTRTPEQLLFMSESYKLQFILIPCGIMASASGLVIGIILSQWIVVAFQILSSYEIGRRYKVWYDFFSILKRSRND